MKFIWPNRRKNIVYKVIGVLIFLAGLALSLHFFTMRNKQEEALPVIFVCFVLSAGIMWFLSWLFGEPNDKKEQKENLILTVFITSIVLITGIGYLIFRSDSSSSFYSLLIFLADVLICIVAALILFFSAFELGLMIAIERPSYGGRWDGSESPEQRGVR